MYHGGIASHGENGSKRNDFVTRIGPDLLDEGKVKIEVVKKMCSYYYVLDPIIGTKASN